MTKLMKILIVILVLVWFLVGLVTGYKCGLTDGSIAFNVALRDAGAAKDQMVFLTMVAQGYRVEVLKQRFGIGYD